MIGIRVGEMSGKTILYIGNKLSAHGFTPTNIETLAPQLARYYHVVSVSDKKNKLARLLHICATIVGWRQKVGLILIDTYSTNAFKFAMAAGWLAFKLKIPYIPILHGGDLPKKIKKATPKERAYFTKATKLVAPSAYLFHQFQQFGFSHLVYIPNNIFLGEYAFKQRVALAPKLFWVRSFHKIYNPNMAVQVLRQLLQIHPGATLCMVGPDKDGSMERAKKVAANYGISDKVVFTGKLSKEEWHCLAVEYDIFINTTTVDNTPVSVIEAMALGLPVVSTNVGGIPYLLADGQNALLVPSANPEEMVRAVNRLLSEDGLAERLAANGRQLVGSFDWEQVKKLWLALVEEKIKNVTA